MPPARAAASPARCRDRAIAALAWLALSLAVAPAVADDAPSRPSDYARGWHLASDVADAGAWRLPLDAAIYRAAASAQLRDIAVFDAAGAEVPAAVFPAPAPPPAPPPTLSLPWFPLSPDDAIPGRDLSARVLRGPRGQVQRVERRGDDGATPPGVVDAWLLDASAARAPLAALQLDWAEDAGDVDVGYRVEGSDDLRDWRTLQQGVRLLDLRDGGGDRSRQARVALSGSARYLRLLPLRRGATFPLAAVDAELEARPQAHDWQWQALDGTPRRTEGVLEVVFELDGRFPVAAADVGSGGNTAIQWTLESRDADDARWRWRAGPWVGWRLDEGGRDRHSSPRPLNEVVRDRWWRLTTRDLAASAPQLRLGWRPESLVFVGQGEGPWTLAAGSGRAARAPAPVAQALAGLRASRDDGWEPAPARIGDGRELGGDAALQPPRHWAAALLWVLLFAGALALALLAINALRRRRPPPPSPPAG